MKYQKPPELPPIEYTPTSLSELVKYRRAAHQHIKSDARPRSSGPRRVS